MFAKFNYSPSAYFYNTVLNSYLDMGKTIYSKHKQEVQSCLSEYITEDVILDAPIIQHSSMTKLNQSSVNTLRIFTFRTTRII